MSHMTGKMIKEICYEKKVSTSNCEKALKTSFMLSMAIIANNSSLMT